MQGMPGQLAKAKQRPIKEQIEFSLASGIVKDDEPATGEHYTIGLRIVFFNQVETYAEI